MARTTFPQIGQKHGFIPLYTAKHIVGGEPMTPKKAIFIYSNSLERRLKVSLSLRAYGHSLGEGGAWEPHNSITKGNELMVVKLPMGAPLTAAAMEEAIVCGTRQFLILGVAGAIGRKLSVSDIVLCTRAIRDEGTSHHYIKSSKYVLPDPKLTAAMEKHMAGRGIAFNKGASWTTDAPYLETKEEIVRYRKEGVLTVDMEASALFAVAIKRKVSAAAIFTISDILGKSWSGFLDKDYKTVGYGRLSEIAKLFRDL